MLAARILSTVSSTNSLPEQTPIISQAASLQTLDGKATVQEVGSEISDFFTWAPAMTHVYYTLKDRKNGILGSKFMWTNHSGYTAKHFGYEHELRVNDVDVFDCKGAIDVDYDWDYPYDPDWNFNPENTFQQDLDECPKESTVLFSSVAEPEPVQQITSSVAEPIAPMTASSFFSSPVTKEVIQQLKSFHEKSKIPFNKWQFTQECDERLDKIMTFLKERRHSLTLTKPLSINGNFYIDNLSA